MNRILSTPLCSALHFLVDGLCLCSLYLASGGANHSNIISIFMTYNLLAFATQPFTGIIADKINKKHWMLLLSVVLLLGATVASSMASISGGSTALFALTAVTAGVGNSLFHVWGGKQTALKTSNDIRALGVFVSTGAFGLAIGYVLCSWALLYTFIILIASVSIIYLLNDDEKSIATTSDDSKTQKTSMVIIIISLLALFVMLRSLFGELFSTGSTEKNTLTVLLTGGLAMAGKMSGGFIAKLTGNVKAFIITALAAMVCMILKNYSPILALSGLFLINCTMPITLFWANKTLPGREGLAFGILAAALMPGYLLSLI